MIYIPVLADGSAGPAEIFANDDTLNARQGTTGALVRADGIMFEVVGNLYVCANVSGEIQVVAPDGSAITTRYTGVGLPLRPEQRTNCLSALDRTGGEA